MPSPLSFEDVVLQLMQCLPMAELHRGDRSGYLYGQSCPYFLYRTSLKDIFEINYAYRFLEAQAYAKDNKASFVEVFERDENTVPSLDKVRDAIVYFKHKKAISITKHFSFAYAHQLSSFELNEEGNCTVYGKCHKNLKSQIHGHNAKLEVTIRGWPSVVTGMVMNFNDLKAKVNKLIDQLDHTNLLDNVDLMQYGPSTCENSLYYLWEELRKDIPILERLRIYETDTSYAEIQRSDYE
jgi:6-pyruvoyltetrahydropterin/6-carboxytetrahydropterin synthase